MGRYLQIWYGVSALQHQLLKRNLRPPKKKLTPVDMNHNRLGANGVGINLTNLIGDQIPVQYEYLEEICEI